MVLIGRRDKIKYRKETARNGGRKSGSKMGERASTNQERGIRRPRGMTWQDDAPLWDARNEWRVSEGGGFPRGGGV